MERRDEKQQKKAHGVVDELHVDVDGADAGDEEGDADVGAVEEASVQRQEGLLGVGGVRELDQAPVLRRAALQRDLQRERRQRRATRFAHTSG